MIAISIYKYTKNIDTNKAYNTVYQKYKSTNKHSCIN